MNRIHICRACANTMKDIECPYCDHSQEVNHDDGFGHEEDVLHQMQCSNCDKDFSKLAEKQKPPK